MDQFRAMAREAFSRVVIPWSTFAPRGFPLSSVARKELRLTLRNVAAD